MLQEGILNKDLGSCPEVEVMQTETDRDEQECYDRQCPGNRQEWAADSLVPADSIAPMRPRRTVRARSVTPRWHLRCGKPFPLPLTQPRIDPEIDQEQGTFKTIGGKR